MSFKFMVMQLSLGNRLHTCLPKLNLDWTSSNFFGFQKRYTHTNAYPFIMLFERRKSQSIVVADNGAASASNPLQSDFVDTDSMDADERYLVRTV